MPKRSTVDLSNMCFQTGRLGRIMPLNVLPVVAGDSISCTFKGVLRLSPTRANVILDPHIDVASFFIPMRHVYDQDGATWEDFIKADVRSTIELKSYAPTLAPGSGAIALHHMNWLPWPVGASQTIPAWGIVPYYQIWNRYFRLPKLIGEDGTDPLPERKIDEYAFDIQDVYGFPAARLPTIYGLRHGHSSQEHDVPAAEDTMALTDFAAQCAKYYRDQQEDWSVTYYDDLISERWKGNTNIDADRRPEIVAHNMQTLKGFNTYGTTVDAAEQVIGRFEGVVGHGWPRRFFPEHGTIWTLMVVRIPDVCSNEQHYLWKKGGSATYKELACDPIVVETSPPEEVNINEFFVTSNSDKGWIPHSEWWRCQPNIVGRNWTRGEESKGYPINPKVPTSLMDGAMHGGGFDNFLRNELFTTQILDDWNLSGGFDMRAMRAVPDAWKSIYSASDVGLD